MIKFNKHFVTDGANKARVFYSYSENYGHPDFNKKCLVVYAKDFKSGDALGAMFRDVGGYKNETDSMTDYFDEGCVRMYEDHPYYAAGMARFEANKAGAAVKKAAEPKPLPAAEIVSDKSVDYSGHVIRSLVAMAGGTEVAVSMGGRFGGCSVVVFNAAHKVWRGMGKSYGSIDLAIKHYKDPKVVAALAAVKALVAVPAAEAVA